MKIPISATPRFQNKITDVSIGADNADIRAAIVKGVPEAKKQMAGAAKHFDGGSEVQTAKNIFDFLKNQVKYVADGEEQVIKLPSALMKPGMAADCKSYALFTAGVLENLGIPYSFVLTSYNENPIPQHIYVRTNSGVIIDAVWGKFNSEKPFKFKYEIPMNVRYMAGLGGCGCGGNCGCGDQGIEGLRDTWNRFKNWVGEKKEDIRNVTQKAGTGAKTVALAPGRGLFRVMVRSNIDGIASALSNMDKTKLLDIWGRIGGNPSKMVEDINTGRGKKAIKMGFLARLKKNAGITGVGIGAVSLEGAIIALSPTAGAAIGSAVPAVGTAAGAAAGTSLGAVLIALIPIVEELLKKTPTTELPTNSTFDPLPPIDDKSFGDEDPNAGGFNSFWNGTPFGGSVKGKHIVLGAAILGAAAYYAKKKNLF